MFTITSVPRFGTVNISAPLGPGQVERITILSDDINITTFANNTLWLYIDDQQVCATSICIMTGVGQCDHVDGPCSGIHVGTTRIDFTISEVYDYETSFALLVQNMESPDPITMCAVLKGRVGR